MLLLLLYLGLFVEEEVFFSRNLKCYQFSWWHQSNSFVVNWIQSNIFRKLGLTLLYIRESYLIFDRIRDWYTVNSNFWFSFLVWWDSVLISSCYVHLRLSLKNIYKIVMILYCRIRALFRFMCWFISDL